MSIRTEKAAPAATTSKPGTSAFRSLSIAMFKGFWRDKMSVFFTILFPMFFIVIFGLVFAGDGNASKQKVVQVGDVAFIDQMPAEARTGFDQVIELTRNDDAAAALEELRQGDVAAVVTEQGTVLTLQYSAADQVASATVQGVFSSFIDSTNVALSGTPPTYSLVTNSVEDESLDAIQYIAPAMIAYGVSIGATFGAAMTLITWRDKKVLRRLRLAPVSTAVVVGSRIGVSLVVAVVQLIIFVGFSMLLGLRLTGSWWMAFPLVLAGTLAFLSIGLLVGAIAKTAEGGAGLANLITLPMAFLSGAFVPLDAAPGWLQTVSQFMPMRYLVEGMKDVMVRGEGPAAALLPIAILIGFAAVLTLLTTRLFKWDNA